MQRGDWYDETEVRRRPDDGWDDRYSAGRPTNGSDPRGPDDGGLPYAGGYRTREPDGYGAPRGTEYRSGFSDDYDSAPGANGFAPRGRGGVYGSAGLAEDGRWSAADPDDWAADPPSGRRSRGSASARRGGAGKSGRDDAQADARRKRRPMPLWQEMPLLLIVAFCLAVLIRTFLVQAFFIPSGSMEDTLLIGDRVLVNKVVYDLRDPKRGEIVVFSGTDSWVPEVPPEPELGFLAKLGRTIGDLVGVSRPGEKDFIKRVVGLPGDKVGCCDRQGRVLVNGRPLDEPYVLENSPLDVPPNPNECRSRRFEEITVPPGEIFVMGDHRLVSQDARCQGPVPIRNVIGKAFVIVWPNEHWARLRTPSTFDDVPAPVAAATPGAAPVQRPLTGAPDGIFGMVMPILLASLFPARTRRNFTHDRRRLGA